MRNNNRKHKQVFVFVVLNANVFVMMTIPKGGFM